MAFDFSNVKRLLLLACAAGASVSLAQAQTAVGAGQPIQFSSPENDGVSTNLPSLTPAAPGLSGLADAIRAPRFNFNAPSPEEPAPMPTAPLVSSTDTKQLQTLLDRRDNWMLLTPEEILGVPTPEKILGVSDRTTDGLSHNQSLLVRYFNRQERQSNTNTLAPFHSPWESGFFDHSPSQGSSNPLNSPDNNLGNSTAMDLFRRQGTAPQGGFGQALEGGQGGTTLFGLPAPQPPVSTGQQQGTMNQFQQLLESPSSSGAPETSPVRFSSRSPTAPDFMFGKSSENSMGTVGAPLAPMTGEVGAPIGVTPLPGILGSTNAPAAEWKPQLPPWMLSGPRPGVIPQRKF